jgi:hypothetical protein
MCCGPWSMARSEGCPADLPRLYPKTGWPDPARKLLHRRCRSPLRSEAWATEGPTPCTSSRIRAAFLVLN